MFKPTLALCVLFIGAFTFSQDMAETDAKVKDADASDVIPRKIYANRGIGEDSPPTIDGLLNDPIWEAVDWVGDYIENRSDENTRPAIKPNLRSSMTVSSFI